MNDGGGWRAFSLKEMPVPMVYATHRIIRECNEEFASLFRYAIADLVDRSFARLYPKHSDFVRTGQMWRANLQEGSIYYDERIMTAGDGGRFWCRVHGRTRNPTDPFAQAIYCFQPLSRRIISESVSLTDRQHQILALVAQGKKSAEISQETGLSIRTIESHRARLMKSIGLKNAAELSAWFSSGKSAV
ncbi:LuxR C-terminal-related transcriptional regulator [Corticibacterium sp. UT-5YL-CI-8]|nr:LuxR C-terminal-related transcriptional regulator [Tianweitania sp. UT-5YL-CI-8]